MKLTRLLSAALLLAPLALPAQAQTSSVRLPKVELTGFTQTEARHLDDYFGRTVLLEFFAHWCRPCGMSVPHVNELQEKYGDRGLSVLGITSEPVAETKEFVRRYGAKYGYAYDKQRTLSMQFGISSIPHSILVDPTGEVVWQGHPAGLTGEIIEKHLGGALNKPLWSWPDEQASVREPIRERAYGKALLNARQLGDGGLEIAAALERLVEKRFGAVKAAHEEGELLTAYEDAEALVKELAGLPQADAAAKIRSGIEGDERSMKIVDAQREMRAMWGMQLATREQAEKLLAQLQGYEKDLEGTRAAKQARTLIDALETLIPRMR